MMSCTFLDSAPNITRTKMAKTPGQPRVNEIRPLISGVRTVSRGESRTLDQEKEPTPNSPTTAELVTRAQGGEEKAFETLFDQHKQRVYALCLRMIGNTAEAEDLTQEAFLQVFRKIHTFRGESAFSTWLHRLSVNIVLMRLRRKTVIETPLEGSATGEESDEPPKEFGTLDRRLAGSIDRLHIERAIAQLPPGYKQIFMLHDVEGYEHNEIAAMLSVSIGNSKSQLHKARMRLRKLLQETARESHRQKQLQAGVA